MTGSSPARRCGNFLHSIGACVRAICVTALNTSDMRFNPLPFVFAPGVGLAGYLIGGVIGAQSALAAWILIVGAASIWTLARGPDDGTADPTSRR